MMTYSIEPLEQRALLSGELDTSFGTAGRVTQDLGTNVEQFRRVAVTTDGKVYAAGVLNNQILLARFTTAGALDPTFANGVGYVLTTVGGSVTGPVSLAVRSDGEAFVGANDANSTVTRATITAFTPAGSIDTSWATAGQWEGAWSTFNPTSTIGALTLNGTTLYAAGANDDSLAVARFTASGSIDTTFGDNGSQLFTAAANNGTYAAVDLSIAHHPGATDTLLIGETFIGLNGTHPVAAVVETGLTGAQGSGFTTALGANALGGDFELTHVTSDSTGRVLMGGDITSDNGPRAAIARLTAAGGLDTTFATNGYYTAGTLSESTVTSLTAIRNGEIVYSGPGGSGSHDNGDYVYALDNTGAFNPNFSPEKSNYPNEPRSSTGLLVSPPGGHYYDVAVQTDGKLVFAGADTPLLGVSDVAVMRLSVESAPPPTGTVTGYVYYDANLNGVKDSGEQTAPGYRVYDDVNNDAKFETGEPSTTSLSGDGAYTLVAPQGAAYIRVVLPTGYRSAPVNGYVANISSTPLGPLNLGLVSQGGLIVSVYNDSNNNGVRDSGESSPAFATQTYIDVNNDGIFNTGDLSQSAVGSTSYMLDPGTYAVRILLPAGYHQTQPANNAAATATVTTDGQTALVSIGISNAAPTTGTITGNVFKDTDGDGEQDNGETVPNGVQYLTAFVDYNGDGVRQPTEPGASPNAQTGVYTINGVTPGTYKIVLLTSGAANYRLRQTVPVSGGGYAVTLAAGETRLIRPFAVQQFAYVSGYVIDDTNGNGLTDSGETGYAGDVVYVDANNNGALDSGELSTTTTSGGLFGLDLPNGNTYALRQQLPAGYVQTAPAGAITVSLGATAISATVGNFYRTPAVATGTLTGFLFNDANANGVQDSGESYYTGYGITAYLDANNDGAYNSGELGAYTGGSGVFGFKNVPIGTYALRLTGINSTNGVVATNFLNGQTVTVKTGVTTYAPGFGVSPATRITVAAFDDANGDGVYASPADFVLTGRTIYADLNNNGAFDTGEPSTTTTGFLTLTNGTYTLRQLLPANWRETGRYTTVTVSGETFAADGRVRIPTDIPASSNPTFYFGSRPVGFFEINAYLDSNGNGTQDNGEAGTDDGGFVYADLNNDGLFDGNDVAGTPSGVRGNTTIQLVPGTYTLRQSLTSGWAQTSPAGNAGQTLTIATGTDGIQVNFGRWQPPVVITGASAAGVVYSDANKNGKQDTGETGLAGVTVYVDTNNNSKLDTGEKSAVTDVNGAYTLTGLTNTGSATRLRAILPTGYTQITPSNGYGYALTLTAGAANPGKTFGLYTPPATGLTATLSGFTFDDTNKNGVYDSTEIKSSGKVVFLDTNNNGKLDSGEKSVTTGTGGTFSFTGLAAGTYHVRRVFPTGYSQSNALIDVTVTAGQQVAGLTIGSQSGTSTPVNTASITGFTFNDANKNGLYDGTDTLAAGKTVFIDLDDGVLDSNETRVVTDSKGAFSFKNLAAGTYHIRRVFPSGYAESTAARYITLTGGQAATAVSIGSKAT